MLPNFESFKNSKQFFVIYIIVQLYCSKSAEVKSNWMNFIFFINNGKDCSKRIVQNISFHNELSIGNLISENRSRDEYLLKRVKSIMTEGVKLSGNILLGETCQWNDNVQIVEDEPVIKISEIQEKDWIFLIFLGSDQSWMILTLLLDMVRPEGERMYSRYSTDLE